MGTGEFSIVNLAKCLIEGDKDRIMNDPFISLRIDRNNYKIGKLYNYHVSFDDLPTIDLNFWKEGVKKLDAIPMITSRGCPYKCSFCYNTFNEKGKYILKPYESIIKEMQLNSKKFYCKNFLFMDDNFLINEERALKIFEYTFKKDFSIKRVYGHLNCFTLKIQEALIKAKPLTVMCIIGGS